MKPRQQYLTIIICCGCFAAIPPGETLIELNIRGNRNLGRSYWRRAHLGSFHVSWFFKSSDMSVAIHQSWWQSYTHIHIYTHTYAVHVFMYAVYIPINIYIYMCVCVYMYMYICRHTHRDIYIYIYIYTYTYICTSAHACMYVRMYGYCINIWAQPLKAHVSNVQRYEINLEAAWSS